MGTNYRHYLPKKEENHCHHGDLAYATLSCTSRKTLMKTESSKPFRLSSSLLLALLGYFASYLCFFPIWLNISILPVAGHRYSPVVPSWPVLDKYILCNKYKCNNANLLSALIFTIKAKQEHRRKLHITTMNSSSHIKSPLRRNVPPHSTILHQVFLDLSRGISFGNELPSQLEVSGG